MSKVSEQWLFLQDVAMLIMYASRIGIVLTGGELYRTKEQQEIHVKAGRSKTMNSRHMERLAIDFNFFVGGVLTYDYDKIEPLGKYWCQLSEKNQWGGYFNSFQDTPHFERKP